MRAILVRAGLVMAAAAASAARSLRVCAGDLTNYDDTPRLALPAALVSATWVQAGGDLRQARLDPNDPPARATGQPRALVSAQHNGRHAQVTPGDCTVFQAVDTLDGDGLRANASEHPGLYEVLAGNILAAAVATPVADTMTIH